MCVCKYCVQYDIISVANHVSLFFSLSSFIPNWMGMIFHTFYIVCLSVGFMSVNLLLLKFQFFFSIVFVNEERKISITHGEHAIS